MPNSSQPPSQQVDTIPILMDIKEVIGRLTQVTVDTRNDVADIKSSQKTSDMKLANIDFKLDDLTKDHAQLKAEHIAVEVRTKALEDKDKERKTAIKTTAAIVSGITGVITFIILNLKSILEFLGLVSGNNN